jgi:CubicO group peptidase (beta-lactamase class C family)
LPTATPQSQGFSKERLSRIRSVIDTEINANRMPGAVVLVARKGAIVHTEALGWQNKDAAVPIKRDTIFRAYSMTKPLVSVVTMMLVEEGKLQLTDPVSKFFPALANVQVMSNPAEANSAREPAKRPILIHDLLRHTSGITYGEFTRFASVKTAYEEAGLFSSKTPMYSITLPPEQQIEAFAKAPLATRHHIRLRFVDRFAGARVRESIRPIARCTARRKAHQAARHERYSLRGTSIKSGAPCRTSQD